MSKNHFVANLLGAEDFYLKRKTIFPYLIYVHLHEERRRKFSLLSHSVSGLSLAAPFLQQLLLLLVILPISYVNRHLTWQLRIIIDLLNHFTCEYKFYMLLILQRLAF